MSEKVKPKCPCCKTVGNMAGTKEGPIFCVTCGARFENKQALWAAMNASQQEQKEWGS